MKINIGTWAAARVDEIAQVLALVILIALAVIMCIKPADAQRITTPALSDTIPSEATGLYVGGGWTCTVLAYTRQLNRPGGLPSIPAPSLEWDCNNSTNRYVGYVASADGSACPQRGWWGYLLGFQPPWGPKGELSIVGYSFASPGSVVFEFRLYPNALPQQIELTRVQTVPSPAPYSCNTTAPKRDR